MENNANKILIYKIYIGLNKTRDFTSVIQKLIDDEYQEYVSELQNTFRTACFTITPYSQLMWGGAYADYHRGFCIEYTVLPDDEAYSDIYYNMFPMIYCKTRPDMTARLVASKDKAITKDVLWDIYSHGALRKSIDWAFQDEWRLLLPIRGTTVSDYNVKFFPITKVYLGNRMKREKRKEIIEICNEKNIPYVGVKRNPNIFEMKDCEMKCEDCPEYKEKENIL